MPYLVTLCLLPRVTAKSFFVVIACVFAGNVSFYVRSVYVTYGVQEFTQQSNSPSMMPMCVKNEKPLLVTTQVKLVDPADEYVVV